MDIDAILKDLGFKPADLARALDVSDGHVADLRSGRRKLSLKLAHRLAQVADRPDIVDAVVREKVRA